MKKDGDQLSRRARNMSQNANSTSKRNNEQTDDEDDAIKIYGDT